MDLYFHNHNDNMKMYYNPLKNNRLFLKNDLFYPSLKLQLLPQFSPKFLEKPSNPILNKVNLFYGINFACKFVFLANIYSIFLPHCYSLREDMFEL